MEIGDDANSNSNYGSPIREMNLMDTVNLTTLPSSPSTSTSVVTQDSNKKVAHSTKTSVNGSNASEASRPPSSPDVTCSSTTPSIPSHSYVSYDGRRYTVFEVPRYFSCFNVHSWILVIIIKMKIKKEIVFNFIRIH